MQTFKYSIFHTDSLYFYFIWANFGLKFIPNSLKPLKIQCSLQQFKMLPWQTKSTRILIKTPFKMRCPAAICSDLRGVNSSLCIGHFCTKNAKLSKILQDVYSERSRNGVKSEWGYYSLILHLPFS